MYKIVEYDSPDEYKVGKYKILPSLLYSKDEGSSSGVSFSKTYLLSLVSIFFRGIERIKNWGS